MVKIAIAGASSQVGHEVLDILLPTKKHEITLLSRQDFDPQAAVEGTIWIKVDYTSQPSLISALSGIHTVLSFIDARHDTNGKSQLALIDACLAAGVKRFAPAEWSVAENPPSLPDGKLPIRSYLSTINPPSSRPRLEYTLFQPGLFLNYLSSPFPSAAHITPINTWFDFHNRRAIVIEGEEETSFLSLTTVQDLAHIVALAVEYESPWPVVGGLQGGTVTAGELIRIGERVRGGVFKVTRLKREDLEKGEMKSEWVPMLGHQSIGEENMEAFSREYVRQALLAGMKGGFTVGDEWNTIFGGYRFTGVEEFVKRVWEGKE